MKHILVPTDFTIASLKAVQAAVGAYEGEQLRVTLFHLLEPNDIGSLFRSMRNTHYQMVTDDFNEACQILHNRHSKAIASIRIKFGFGTTVRYIENFLEGLKIDAIAYCSNINLQETSPRSVAMLPLLLRSGYPVNALQIPRAAAYHTDINTIPQRDIKVLKEEEESYAIAK
jgi:hypothetical protein